MSSDAHSDASSLLKPLLFGLVVGITVVDTTLLVAPPATGADELLRLILAGGALAVPLLGFAVGLVHRPIYAVGAVLSIPLVAVYASTGLLLPWTQLSFALGQIGLELLLGIPVAGEPAAIALFGGTTLSQATLKIAFRLHYAVVALGAVAIVAVAVSIARRHRSGSSTESPFES